MLDTIYPAETPEGVGINFHPVGPVVRGLAFMIDMFIKAVTWSGCAVVLGIFGNTGMGLFLLIAFFLEWFYPVVFEVYAKGRTPGKMAMGISVIHMDGSPVGWRASLIRNLMRVADFMPLAYGLGIGMVCGTKRFQRAGDMVAGTLVVYKKEGDFGLTIPKAEPTPTVHPLDLDEQRAIINLAERSSTLSMERQEELADILEPLTSSKGAASVNKLYGHAAYMMGRRQ